MFFSEDLLTSKNGKLGIIWLAATLGPRNRKITKKQLTTIDLSKTCELIAQPPEPLALRLSGCLLVGVARVYSQNYELFYTEVNNFQSTLRRTIVADIATTGGMAISGGILDLPGGGLSKLDQITFASTDMGWFPAPNMSFAHIDWHNPFATAGRKRRASSKLSSLQTNASQQTTQEDEEDEEDELSEPENMRGIKRSKVTPSYVGKLKDTTLKRSSIYHPSDRTSPYLYPDLDFQPGQEVDLGLDLLPQAGDDSFSGPSGRGIELVNEDVNPGDTEFFVDQEPHGIEGRDRESSRPIPGNNISTSNSDPLKSPMKRRRGSHSEGSVGEVEEQVEPKKKGKRSKKARFDQDLELGQDDLKEWTAHYADIMNNARREMRQKEAERGLVAAIGDMVDNFGGTLTFLDRDMSDFFRNLHRPDKFEWEKDMARCKAGKEVADTVPAEEERLNKQHHDILDPMPGNNGEDTQPYQEVYQDFEVPVTSRPRRDSEVSEVEQARKASQGSLRNDLPWELPSFDSPGGALNFTPGGNSSFSAGSLKLSVMTPQELRLRLKSRSGSITGRSHQGRFRQRSRSGSLQTGGVVDDNLMLAPGDDLELPDDQGEVVVDDIGASQLSQGRRHAQALPEAFQPEMLASLEKLCRDFFSYVEKRMVEEKKEDLEFDELVPAGSGKRVAVSAFYNCLTLTTKKILSVEQQEPFGDIRIRFAIPA